MPKILKIIGKVTGALVLGLIVFLIAGYFIYNEKLPQGIQSIKADALAEKMLIAVNHEAFDSTRYLEWTFRDQHHFIWDKKLQLVDVIWKENIVQLNINHPELSTVVVNGIKVNGPEKLEIITKAVAYFNNDSFWLVAPHKVFDPGTERRVITRENGEEALLVTYNSGGDTPGDSYLWLLDKSGLPNGFKMWVSIIPIGGLEATWESWKKTESGALLPTHHSLLFMDLSMGDVQAR